MENTPHQHDRDLSGRLHFCFIDHWGTIFRIRQPFRHFGFPRPVLEEFLHAPVLYFITVNTVRKKEDVWKIITIMCLAMALMGYYTSSQVSWFSSLLSRGKIAGTFEFLGPNEVAAFYNQYTIILLSVYFFMKKGIKKTLLLLLILLNIYCMMFMYSRAAYLGAAVGLFLLFSFKNNGCLSHSCWSPYSGRWRYRKKPCSGSKRRPMNMEE